MALIIIIL